MVMIFYLFSKKTIFKNMSSRRVLWLFSLSVFLVIFLPILSREFSLVWIFMRGSKSGSNQIWAWDQYWDSYLNQPLVHQKSLASQPGKEWQLQTEVFFHHCKDAQQKHRFALRVFTSDTPILSLFGTIE